MSCDIIIIILWTSTENTLLHEVVCKRSHSSVRGGIKSMASSNLACC